LGEAGGAGLEEERRLAYVGLTRARERAIILFAANRRVHNQWQSSLPSRFVEELPLEHTERTNVGGHSQPFRRRASAPKLQTIQPPVRSLDKKEFQVNQRVFHLKFGYGRVLSVDGDKVEIDFDHTGVKMVMKSFLESA